MINQIWTSADNGQSYCCELSMLEANGARLIPPPKCESVFPSFSDPRVKTIRDQDGDICGWQWIASNDKKYTILND